MMNTDKSENGGTAKKRQDSVEMNHNAGLEKHTLEQPSKVYAAISLRRLSAAGRYFIRSGWLLVARPATFRNRTKVYNMV